MKARLGAFDRSLSQKMRNTARGVQPFWLFIASHGIWVYPIAAAVFVIAGWLPWYHAILPVLFAYVWVVIIQWAIHRKRPHYDKSVYKMWLKTPSFPSGHATESFAAATALAFLPTFPTNDLFIGITVFLYACAVAISLSRVYIGVHFLFDIIAGFLLGTFMSALYVFLV